MAFCNNCGAELPEGSKFCTSCGTKNEEAPKAAPVQETPVYETPVTEAPKQSAYSAAPVQKEKKPVNKKLFIIIGAAVLALILVIVVIVVIVNIVKTNQAIKNKTLVFEKDFFEVEFSGYDTLGTVDVYLTDEFEDAAFDALGYTSKKDRKKNKAKEKLSELKYAIDYEISKDSELTNGDEVTIKVVLLEDNDADIDIVKDNAKKKDKKDADVIIKEIELKYTVEDLPEVEKYNPFDDLEIEMYGADGDVTVYWTYVGDQSYIWSSDFSCDNDYDLSIGDEFTITLDESTIDYLLEGYGVLVTESSKTYTVETADKYIESIKDISDDLLEEMKEIAVEEIEDDSYYSDGIVSDIKYMGMYLLTSDDDNMAVLVYSANFTPDDYDYDEFTIYNGVEISDLYEYADGTQSSSSYGYVTYNYEYVAEDSWDSFYGFFTEKELYDAIVEDYGYEYEMELSSGVTDYSDWVEPEEEEYDSIEAFLESEAGSTYVSDAEDDVLDVYDEYYSDLSITAVENDVTYEYTYIEAVEEGALDDTFTDEGLEGVFEEWTELTGVEEITINVIFYNPDGTEVYNGTFSNY